MAWRIQDSVIRGEIDNRTKGRVLGRLWLRGLDKPVTLRLTGNARGDLAGCRLRFENPNPALPLRPDARFNLLQQGTAGDLTASRKVRVFDIPIEQACAMIKRGETPPEHWANSLYLEWFSEANGRVVIEGADWAVEISAPAWRLSPEEERPRAADAAAGMTGFLGKLAEAMEAKSPSPSGDLEEWDEFDWEKALRESDARTEKYLELLEKHGGDPQAEELIAREMGWDPEDEAEELSGREVEEANRLGQEAARARIRPIRARKAWIGFRTEDGDIVHPLQHHCFCAAMELWHECDSLGLAGSDDPDLDRLLTEFQITSVKLAGALNGLAHGRCLHEGGFIVACLKRALAHLHAAQSGLEKAAPKRLLPQTTLKRVRLELFRIREAILDLMKRFRARG